MERTDRRPRQSENRHGHDVADDKRRKGGCGELNEIGFRFFFFRLMNFPVEPRSYTAIVDGRS